MPQEFDVTVSDLETLPGADLDDGDRILISRPGAFDKTVTWGDVKEELGVGVDLTALQNEVAGKAPSVHQHIPADIQGKSQPNGFATLDATGKIPILQIPDGIGGGGSVGGIEDVPGLQAALDGKAATVHTQAISTITGLQPALDGKAAVFHGHAASEITSGVLATARLGTGTPSAANYLRGDGAWAAIAQSEVAGLSTSLASKIDTAARGAANGVASLDASTLVPSAQIPTLDLTKLSSSGATTGQVVSFNGSAVVWASPTSGNPNWTIRTANATLAANENCVASTGVTALTLPASPSGSHHLVNSTANVISLNRGGTATIGGISDRTGVSFSGSTTVRIAPGNRAVLVADGANWIAQGCDQLFATEFSYTGSAQNFVVPNAIGAIAEIFCRGAGGAGSDQSLGGGGGAAFCRLVVAATTNLSLGQIAAGALLKVVVGRGGQYGAITTNIFGGGRAGQSTGGQGGDYSGLFLGSVSQANSVAIAGGGGGACGGGTGRNGGPGGGTTGATGSGSGPGTGGSQSAGGSDGGGALTGGGGNPAGVGGGGGSGYNGGGATPGAGGGGGGAGFLPSGALSGSTLTTGSGQSPAALTGAPANTGTGGNAASNGQNGWIRIEVS